MARPLRFIVYAGKTEVKARLVKLGSKTDPAARVCPYCNCDTNLMYIAFTVQYGFYYNLYHYVYNCQQCQQNIAFQFELKLTEAEAIERLKGRYDKD